VSRVFVPFEWATVMLATFQESPSAMSLGSVLA
jgi:hypothetical protein